MWGRQQSDGYRTSSGPFPVSRECLPELLRINRRPDEYTGADLFHINQQRLLVILPLDGKLADVWELIAGKLHGDFKAVGVQVTEVIHTCREDRNRGHTVKKWIKGGNQ